MPSRALYHGTIAIALIMTYNEDMGIVIGKVCISLLSAAIGGALSSFYWSGDDAGSWTPWWEVIVWLFLTAAGAAIGVKAHFPLSIAISFSVPMFGMMPVAVVVHILKRRHTDE